MPQSPGHGAKLGLHLPKQFSSLLQLPACPIQRPGWRLGFAADQSSPCSWFLQSFLHLLIPYHARGTW